MILPAADRAAIRHRPSDVLVTHLREFARAFKAAREGLSKSHPTEWWTLTIGDVLEDAATRIQRGVARSDRVYSPEHTDQSLARVQALSRLAALERAEQQREQVFTIAQIKAAFWAQFHEAGELWFPYTRMGARPSVCERATQQVFDEFMQKLAIGASPEKLRP